MMGSRDENNRKYITKRYKGIHIKSTLLIYDLNNSVIINENPVHE